MHRPLAVAALLLLPLAGPAARASTGFHLGSGASGKRPEVYAISTGWYYPVHAAAMVNARHVRRTAGVPWPTARALEWESRFGSVSVTMNGAGYPMSGTNEKGLMIQATLLKGKTAPAVPGGSFAMNALQWIQYHLDTSASVDEVVAKSVKDASIVMPWSASYDVQFQVCDPSGCAILAFYDGKAVAHGAAGRVERDVRTGAVTVDAARRYELGAIANDAPEDALDAFARCSRAPCPPASSPQRLTLAARAAARRAPAGTARVEELVSAVFDDLRELDQGAPLTTWNEAYVFDPARGSVRLFYKSPKRPDADLQWIDFGAAEYDCARATTLWWLDMDGAGGDQTARGTPLTREAQERLAGQHARARGGYMSDDQVREAVDYPTQHARCAAP